MKTTPLIDSHCHLDFADFGAERDEVLARARNAGVRAFVTIGAGRNRESAVDAAELAEQYSDVFATVGVHPHDASCASAEVEQEMTQLARRPRVVAIGEVGLDYHYDHSPRDVQANVFRRFVALAREVAKPLVIHTRSAPNATLEILREEHARDVGGVIHCFTEDESFAKAALDLGFMISFSGIVTFKNSESLRAVARTVPLDRLLIETDAPFLAPMPRRGKRNEPAFVVHTAAHLSATIGVQEERLRACTTANAISLFGLASIAPELTEFQHLAE